MDSSNSTGTPTNEKQGGLPLFFKLGAILSVVMVFVPIILTMKHTQIMQTSDFVMTFYVVGNMVSFGHGADIYPGLHAANFIDSQFNAYAHQLLPSLAKQSTAVYMYSPLVACAFAPFGLLTPIQAMVAWQLTSILALTSCAWIHSRISENTTFLRLFCVAALFAPVFHQILIGHLAIPLGLLPLSAGYYFLMKERYLAGGFVWALLFLKPQFLPTVLLVIGALTLARQFRPLIGFAAGSALMTVATALCLGPETARKWLGSFRLSDAIFSDPRYNYPHYLAVSIPSAILQLVPAELRNTAKVPAYALAAVIGLASLWIGTRLLRRHGVKQHLPSVMLMGIMVLPLVLPHFLFYDLVCMVIAAFVIFGSTWDEVTNRRLKLLRLVTFVILNIYFIFIFFIRVFNHYLILPAGLVVVLILIYWNLLKILLASASAKPALQEPLAPQP